MSYLLWAGLGAALIALAVGLGVWDFDRFDFVVPASAVVGISIVALVLIIRHADQSFARQQTLSPCVRAARAYPDILEGYDMQVQPDGSCSFTRRER